MTTITPADHVLAPGPRAAASLYWLRQLRKDPLLTTERLAAEYGDVTRIQAPGTPLLIIRGAEPAHRILVSGQDHYAKARVFRLFRPAMGEGLVTSEDETWRASRRVVQPLFAKRYLGVYAEHMSSAAAAALERWDREWTSSRRVLLDEEMLHIGLDTVGRALISGDLADDALTLGDSMTGALLELGNMMGNPRMMLAQVLLRREPSDAARIGLPRRWKRYTEHSRSIEDICTQIVDRRHTTGHGERDDLLRLLIEATDSDSGKPLSRQQVVDELRTFIGAGHETTAHGLTWMFHLLAKNPECLARAEREIDDVLGGERPDASTAEQLPYLTACFQEALRLYPPAWVIPRTALHDDTVAGYHVPEGSELLVSVWATHRDPSVYPDPERFDPARWLDDAAKGRPRFSYLPFGGGRRACVGQGFAMLNARILAAMVMQKYRFRTAGNAPVELMTSITLRARHGVPMVAERR